MPQQWELASWTSGTTQVRMATSVQPVTANHIPRAELLCQVSPTDRAASVCKAGQYMSSRHPGQQGTRQASKTPQHSATSPLNSPCGRYDGMWRSSKNTASPVEAGSLGRRAFDSMPWRVFKGWRTQEREANCLMSVVHEEHARSRRLTSFGYTHHSATVRK